MNITEVQRSIVEKHLANDFPLFKKYASSLIGVAGFNPAVLSASYDLNGLANSDQHLFLPHFEFNVGTKYLVYITSSMSRKIYEEGDRIRLKMEAKDNGREVEVAFPTVKDLFYLRNLAREGQLSLLIDVSSEDRGVVPLEESQIQTCFHFRASSTTHGQLVAVMDIDHPDAEEIIRQYLETVDKRFNDYRGLGPYFQERDHSGRILWEDQNLQSKKYNVERKKLHKALFGELTNIFKEVNLHYQMF